MKFECLLLVRFLSLRLRKCCLSILICNSVVFFLFLVDMNMLFLVFVVFNLGLVFGIIFLGFVFLSNAWIFGSNFILLTNLFKWLGRLNLFWIECVDNFSNVDGFFGVFLWYENEIIFIVNSIVVCFMVY